MVMAVLLLPAVADEAESDVIMGKGDTLTFPIPISPALLLPGCIKFIYKYDPLAISAVTAVGALLTLPLAWGSEKVASVPENVV